MPTSLMADIPCIMAIVEELQPESVLDLGVGFGKYGVLLREALDGQIKQLWEMDWQGWELHKDATRIVGVEVWPYYEGPAWDCYSGAVWIADFGDEDYWPKYRGFDLVLMIGSLEHLGKHDGGELLRHLTGHNKVVLVSTPIGYREQGAVGGNEFEVHRCGWQPHDFEEYGGVVVRNTGRDMVVRIG